MTNATEIRITITGGEAEVEGTRVSASEIAPAPIAEFAFPGALSADVEEMAPTLSPEMLEDMAGAEATRPLPLDQLEQLGAAAEGDLPGPVPLEQIEQLGSAAVVTLPEPVPLEQIGQLAAADATAPPGPVPLDQIEQLGSFAEAGPGKADVPGPEER